MMFDKLLDWADKRPGYVWGFLLFSIWFLFVGWSIYDRKPPTKVLSSNVNVPSNLSGEDVTFQIPVTRDLGRHCIMSVQRSIVDSTGAIQTYGTAQRINLEGMRERQVLMGDYFKMTVTIPKSLPVGRAHLLVDTSFICLRNPSTFMFPIDVAYSWPFDVLPNQK